MNCSVDIRAAQRICLPLTFILSQKQVAACFKGTVESSKIIFEKKIVELSNAIMFAQE